MGKGVSRKRFARCHESWLTTFSKSLWDMSTLRRASLLFEPARIPIPSRAKQIEAETMKQEDQRRWNYC